MDGGQGVSVMGKSVVKSTNAVILNILLGAYNCFRKACNGTPLQYSCLENPMDGGAWWAAVHGVARVGHD